LPAVATLYKAKNVWVQKNNLSQFTLSSANELKTLLTYDNAITKYTLPELPALENFWMANNQLTTLTLDGVAPALVSLDASGNKLTSIVWDEDCKTTCGYVYVENNALFINSMPIMRLGTKSTVLTYEPQEAYVLATEPYDLNTIYNLKDAYYYNGWGGRTSASYTLTDDTGYELVKGTDFTETSQRFKFLVAHTGVVLKVSNSYYAFETAPFDIGTSSGITDATVANGKLQLRATHGQLSITAADATGLQVVTLAGQIVARTQLAAGSHTLVLPAGVYVVNGQKVIIP